MSFRAAVSVALSVLSLSAQGAFTIFYAKGTSSAELVRLAEPYRREHPEEDCSYVALEKEVRNMEAAEAAAASIRAGVEVLPSLALSDEQGVYAVVPLTGLTKELLGRVRRSATDAQRQSKAAVREYRAAQYLLFAGMALRPPQREEEVLPYIAECRRLMSCPQAAVRDRQLLGLRALYPLLLQQYAFAYQGAHTAKTEALFLEAVAALEAARDADPNSKPGREAYQERERLRAARRQAIPYE